MNRNEHSDEFNKVIVAKPLFIVRWGISLVLLIFAALLVGAYFIKYPVLLSLPVQLIENDKDTTIQTFIPAAKINTVKIGYSANIKLADFPFEKYGVLKAKVDSISTEMEAQGYYAEMKLTNGLITNTQKRLVISNQTNGSAQILTGEIRLLEQVFFK